MVIAGLFSKLNNTFVQKFNGPPAIYFTENPHEEPLKNTDSISHGNVFRKKPD